MPKCNVYIYFCLLISAGIGRTGTFIVIDILIDIIREKGKPMTENLKGDWDL